MDSQTRQEFVRAAVVFLQNPQLTDSSLQDKLKFLRDKGLSEIEVDEALNLALVKRNQTSGGKWNFLLVLGLCIGGYKLYQAYVESKTKSTKQQQDHTSRHAKNTQAALQGLNNVSSKLEHNPEENQPTLNDILQKMTELKKLIELQRTNMGTEIQSLKTLLLSHEKFAAPPKIPAWQLGDEDAKDESSVEKDAVPKETTKGGKKKAIDKNKRANHTDGNLPNNGITESVIAPNLE